MRWDEGGVGVRRRRGGDADEGAIDAGLPLAERARCGDRVGEKTEVAEGSMMRQRPKSARTTCTMK